MDHYSRNCAIVLRFPGGIFSLDWSLWAIWKEGYSKARKVVLIALRHSRAAEAYGWKPRQFSKMTIFALPGMVHAEKNIFWVREIILLVAFSPGFACTILPFYSPRGKFLANSCATLLGLDFLFARSSLVPFYRPTGSKYLQISYVGLWNRFCANCYLLYLNKNKCIRIYTWVYLIFALKEGHWNWDLSSHLFTHELWWLRMKETSKTKCTLKVTRNDFSNSHI